jgi:hypothetical protein
MVRTNKTARDERTVELEDLALDRKTGGTGHSFLIPIEGEAEWFEEVRMQTVVTDGHPLAFLDKERSWIYIRLTVLLDDPEGTLKQKLNERLALIQDYAAYVSKRILEFNRELADKMTEHFNRRKNGILKAKNETEAIRLPTAHNPKHSETTIQVERLMQRLNARFTQPLTYAEQLFEEVKELAGTDSALDVETAKLLIEKADDALKEFGSTSQEKKVELRKWKAQAELVLPPITIEELRKRAEGQLLKKSYPKNAQLRQALLAVMALVVVIGTLISVKRFILITQPSSIQESQLPATTPQEKVFDYWTREKTENGVSKGAFRSDEYKSLETCEEAERKEGRFVIFGCRQTKPTFEALRKRCKEEPTDFIACDMARQLEGQK